MNPVWVSEIIVGRLFVNLYAMVPDANLYITLSKEIALQFLIILLSFTIFCFFTFLFLKIFYYPLLPFLTTKKTIHNDTTRQHIQHNSVLGYM